MSGSFGQGNTLGSVQPPLTGGLSPSSVYRVWTWPQPFWAVPWHVPGRRTEVIQQGQGGRQDSKVSLPGGTDHMVSEAPIPQRFLCCPVEPTLTEHTVKDKVVKNFKTVIGKTLNPKWFLLLRMEPCAAANPVSNNPRRQMSVVTKIKEAGFRSLQWLGILCH